MSVTGFWVVGVVPDGEATRIREEFPGADSFGRHDPEPSGDLELWSRRSERESFFESGPYGLVPTELAWRLRDALAAMGSADQRHEALKQELL